MPDRKPDAVLCPTLFDDSPLEKHKWFRDHIYGLIERKPNELVGAKHQGNQSFIGPVDATLLFPTLHPLAGRERYDWYVVAEDAGLEWLSLPVRAAGYADLSHTVRFGFLKDEALEQPADLDSRAAFAAFVARRNTDHVKLMAKLSALATKADRTSEEDRELRALGERIEKLADATFSHDGRSIVATGTE